MGQIVRRKKKGRPSKADLARRSGQSPATTQSDLRRSRRRRNVRYNIIDYDDYLDEEDEDEDEDERRREKKKLKLVEKLNQGADEEDDDDEDEPAPTRGRPRVVHAHDEYMRKNEDGDEEDEGDEEGEEEVEEEEGIEDVEEREDDEGGTERGEVCEEIQILRKKK